MAPLGPRLIQSKNPAWPNYVSDVKNAPGRFDVYWLTDNQQPAISGDRGARSTTGGTSTPSTTTTTRAILSSTRSTGAISS